MKTIKSLALGAMTFALPAILPAASAAKDIVKEAKAKKSVNKFLIRADGLACYFCAYGLERYFKKAGTVAAFDIHMKEGIVEATLIKGESILSVETLSRYIYDAGFTFRSIKAVLVGRVEEKEGRFFFRVTDTGDVLPVKKNSALKAVLKDQKLADREIQIIAAADKVKDAPMVLAIEKAEPWKEKEG